jgi:tRNA dimethylallyltransferase
LAEVRHHLIGHTSIFTPYTAGHFTRDALAVLDDLFATHDIVFLTGGTGLYVKALTEGFDDIPEVPDEVNEHWTRYWRENGTEALAARLQEMDPAYFEVVDKANPMRLIRAIAVCDHTGLTFSSFLKGEKTVRPFRIFPVVIDLPRKELYDKINKRVLKMIDMGWLEEAKALYPHKDLKALQTVGYKELFDHLEGKLTLPQAISAIQQSTRRYAKRQLTWWRHQGSWHSFSPDDVLSIINAIDLELEA